MTESRKVQLEFEVNADTTGLEKIADAAQDMAQAVQAHGQEAAQGLNAVSQAAAPAAEKLDAAQQRMRASFERLQASMKAGEKGTTEYLAAIAGVRNIDTRPFDALIAETRALEQAQKAAKQATADAARADTFIASLKAQADSAGRTRSEILALQAAELGLTGQASQYIAQLRAMEQGQTAVGTSAKQTAFAMRSIPAQLQDIAVSIQGGQNPLTVLTQQGSQIATVFGGVGPALRGVATYLLGLVNPYTVAAAAAIGLTVAFVQGAKEQQAYQRALILTGNAVGVTASQLGDMARALDSGKFTQSEAAAGLAEMVKSSGAARDQLQRFTAVALEMERATGQAISKTAAQFKALQDAPLEASVKLNAEIHHLTAALYEQIRVLDEQGRHTDAARVATEAYADASGKAATQIIANNGALVKSYDWALQKIKELASAALNIGRDKTGSEQLAALKNQLATLEHSGTTRQDPQAVAQFDAARKKLSDQIALIETLNKRQAEGTQEQAKQNRELQDKIAWDQQGVQFLTKQQQLRKELTKAETEGAALVKAGLITEEQLRTRLAGVREKFKDPAAPKIARDAFQTDTIRDYSQALDAFQKIAGSAAAKSEDLSKTQEELRKVMAAPTWAEYNRQQQEQIIYEASLAQAKEDGLAATKASEQAAKAFTAAVAAGQQETIRQTVASEETAAAAERELQGFGLLKSQIQALTLARLEDERAAGDASASDLDQLDRRIEAQKRLIEATRGIESKEAAKKAADESAREWERAAASIEQSLTDALLRGFESGKGFAENFRDSLKNLFATLVLRPIIQGVMSPVSGALTSIGQNIGGAIVGGGGSALGAGGSLLSTAGSASSLVGLGSSIGTAFTAGSSSVGVMAGSVAGSGGLLGGAASALGAIGPVGWVALAALAAYAIFGGKGGGAKSESGFGVGVPTRGDPASAKTIVDAIQQQYSGIARGFGATPGQLDLGVFTAADPKGDAKTQLAVNAALNGQSVYSREARLGGIENVGRSQEELQAALAEESERVVLDALQATNLPGKIGDYLRQLGDIDKLSGGALDAAVQKLQKAMTERATLEEQYFSLTHTALEASARAREKERETIDDTNLALFDQLTVISQVTNSLATAQAATEASKAQLVQAYDAEKAAREQEISTAKQSAQAHRDLAASLRDSSSALLQSDAFSDPQRTASALASLQINAAQAVAGDQAAAQRLGGIGSDYLTGLSNTAQSGDEYRAGVALVRRVLEGAGVAQDSQASVEQQQLDAAQAQLDATTAQLTAMGVLQDTVMSVGDALAAYLGAISSQAFISSELQREQLLWQKVLAGDAGTSAPAAADAAAPQDSVAAGPEFVSENMPQSFDPAAGPSGDPAYRALEDKISALTAVVEQLKDAAESMADHTYKTKLATEELRDKGVFTLNSPSGEPILTAAAP